MLIDPQNSQKIMRSGIFLDPNSGLNGNGILGYHCRLWRNVQFAQASIGSYSYTLSSLNLASCGNYCSIAHAVNFANPHPVDRLTTSPLTNFDPAIDNVFHDFGIKKEFDRNPFTKIGSDVWIGANVTIKCGVKIHDGAIIGAGAVVTKDVPPFAVMGGYPQQLSGCAFPRRSLRGLYASNGSIMTGRVLSWNGTSRKKRLTPWKGILRKERQKP